MKRPSLAFRLALGPTLLIVAAIFGGVLLLREVHAVTYTLADMFTRNELTSAATERAGTSLQWEDNALEAAFHEAPGAEAALDLQRARVDEALSGLRDELAVHADGERVDGFVAKVRAYREAADRERASTDELELRRGRVEPLLYAAIAEDAHIAATHFKGQHGSGGEVLAQLVNTQWTIVGMLVAGAVASALATFVFARQLARPLLEVARAAAAITDGETLARVGIPSRRTPRGPEVDGLIAAFDAMAASVTASFEELRRANVAELRRAHHQGRRTLELLPTPTVLLDARGLVVEANLAARAILRPIEGAAAGTQGAFGVPLDAIAVEAAEGEARTSDFTRSRRVIVDGVERRFLPAVVQAPAVSADAEAGGGAEEGTILQFIDVTELAQRDEGRMSAVSAASHEMRGPLTALTLALDQIEAATAGKLDAGAQDAMERAKGVTAALRSTAEEFLDLRCLEAGTLEIDAAATEVSAVVDAAAGRWAPELAEVGIQLTVRDGARGAVAVLDARRVRTVIDNLMRNAVAYAGGAGGIRLEAVTVVDAEGASWVEIAVVDGGPGIPEAERGRVFEPFVRGERETGGGRRGGFGLGLHLCAMIAALHGGRMCCDAGDEGRGTRMAIRLPRAERGDVVAG